VQLKFISLRKHTIGRIKVGRMTRPRQNQVTKLDNSISPEVQGELELNFQEQYSITLSVSHGDLFLSTEEIPRTANEEDDFSFARIWFDAQNNQIKVRNPITDTVVSVTLT